MRSLLKWLKNENILLPYHFVVGRIRRKQLAALLVIALIPLLLMGLVSYDFALKKWQDQAAKQLEGVRNLKGKIVQAYFAERRKDLEQLADIMARLHDAEADKMTASLRIKRTPDEAESTAAIKKIITQRLGAGTVDMIKEFRKEWGFENIYLIDRLGYVFHAARHGSDRYTNLLTGPYKNTNLSRLTANVLRTKSFGMADFENYMPAQHAPAAFMAQPVVLNGKVKFVVAVQLSISQINAIAGEQTGLGESGQTYFVGHNKLLRNDSRRLKKNSAMTTILSAEHKVDTEASRSALRGASGTKLSKNAQGIRTLSSWQPLSIVAPNPVNSEGLRWALITEVDESEVLEPIRTFALIIAGTMAMAVLLVIGGGYFLSGGLTRQIKHIMALFSEIGVGNFSARCKVVSRDELGVMANSLNAMLDNVMHLIQSSEERDEMQNSIMRLLTDISALTEGDLTIRAAVTEDMTGAIADSFNTMAEQLSHLVSDVKHSTLEVSSTSREVSETTIKMSKSSDEHALKIKQAVKSIGEMSKSIHLVSEHASESARVSDQAMQNALSGAEAVRETNTAMNVIREMVQEAARAIKRLGESSQEIGNIVQIINDIADRTSILALNASIQAAMAGDAGRGFAVVADEVQRLAEQSTKSTQQIETLVRNIQGEISEAGSRMEDSIQGVVQGTRLADGAHTKLEEIESVSAHLADLVQAISMAAKEQAESSEEISETMRNVGAISSQASIQGRQTALSITNLAKTSEQLRESVEVFKLDDRAQSDDDDDIEVLGDECLVSQDDEDLEVLPEAV